MLPTAFLRGETGAWPEALSGCPLGPLDPGAAPARSGDLFTSKDGTAANRVCGLACVRLATSTFLVLTMLRILFRIRLGGVGDITARSIFEQHGSRQPSPESRKNKTKSEIAKPSLQKELF